MTAPLVVLAFLVVAWAAVVCWSAWRRRCAERAAIERAAAWVRETTRTTGDIAAAMRAATEGIEKFGAAFLADEESPR